MSKLKLISASEFQRILLGLGFIKIRQKGSHAFFRHKDGRTTTIPFHSSEQPTNLKVRGFKSQFTRLSNSK